MNIQTQEMYSEVYNILNMLGESYINKLPKNLYDMIKEEKSESYNPQYILTMNLSEQNIKRDTLAMISLFHLKYWCSSNEEKEELRKKFKTNEDEYQEKLRKKYNPDNIFSNSIQETKLEENTIRNQANIVEYKESIFKKIINKIKNIFHIKDN